MQIPNMEGSAGIHDEDTDMAAPHPRAVLKADTFLWFFALESSQAPQGNSALDVRRKIPSPCFIDNFSMPPRQMVNSIVTSDLKKEQCVGAEVTCLLHRHISGYRLEHRIQKAPPFVSISQCTELTVWNEQICLSKCIDADMHAIPKASCIVQDSLSVGSRGDFNSVRSCEMKGPHLL